METETSVQHGAINESMLPQSKVNALSSPCRHRCSRSFYGVSPHCHFGPKGKILEEKKNFLHIPDPASQKLEWSKLPTTVLVIIKMFEVDVTEPFCELLSWLIQEMHMHVIVETRVLNDQDLWLKTKVQLSSCMEHVRTLSEDEDVADKVDLIICLGGDGTLLHASSLFQRSVPPIMAFHFGSLGFLAPFDFINFRQDIEQVLQGNVHLTLRSRLKCILKKKNSVQAGSKSPHPRDIAPACGVSDKAESAPRRRDVFVSRFLVLNEVVIERGQSSFLIYLDLYMDKRFVTSVQGDGLIIATPSGSTAYSLSAGASMVHPNVPSILITPICPHSLSFRPIIIPAGVDVEVILSENSRNSAWVSFDGRSRQEITVGDSINITTASYPLPHIRKKDRISDWFDSLAECFHWNVRKPQRNLSSTTIASDCSHDNQNNSVLSDDGSSHSVGDIEFD